MFTCLLSLQHFGFAEKVSKMKSDCYLHQLITDTDCTCILLRPLMFCNSTKRKTFKLKDVLGNRVINSTM